MKIAIITKSLPPLRCGIADHSILLGKALVDQGNEVVFLANCGQIESQRIIINSDLIGSWLSQILTKLTEINVDHIILQYTPLMYSNVQGNQDISIVKFWQICSQQWKTSIIVHETYFQRWTYPLSWWKGYIQKRSLEKLVDISHFVFTASQTLLNELASWGYKKKLTLLPLGSHFPLALEKKDLLRQNQRISSKNIVLTIFGGGTALKWKRNWVNKLDNYLGAKQIPITWLLLGGVPVEWFKLSHPVLIPGRLSEIEISHWLQVSDIFLLPHECGLNAKRSTLMAALQHGLPVVGTKSYMTDPFWSNLEGVTLIDVDKSDEWCEAVLVLCNDSILRHKHGQINREYYQNCLRWGNISNIFLNKIK